MRFRRFFAAALLTVATADIALLGGMAATQKPLVQHQVVYQPVEVSAPVVLPTQKPDLPFTAQYQGEFEVFAYCTEQYPHICGGNPTTYSGNPVMPGFTVAVDPSVIPLGSMLYIEGIGVRFAHDTGSAINGSRIDMAVAQHQQAIDMGVRQCRVWVLSTPT
ncbi:Cell wall-binding protein yocH precursor [Anaerotruncus sp. 2789STDY5834896]|uniref:Cell wall-binding protein yocH n=1 Tax=uncultured Anaerotruncus sp. TaxID=905011 RepID=A0A1C6HWP2_9FIRM|nr:Cell wall-binding protein yocH precursor [uncultured Anaerotruncus sp.]